MSKLEKERQVKLQSLLNMVNKFQGGTSPSDSTLLKFVQGRIDPTLQSLDEGVAQKYLSGNYGYGGKSASYELSNDGVYKALDNYFLKKGMVGEQ